MRKVDKEKTRYYLAKIHILFRGNFRTQVRAAAEEKGGQKTDLPAFCQSFFLFRQILTNSVDTCQGPYYIVLVNQIKISSGRGEIPHRR